MKLDIIAYTFRKIMNSHCAKLYVKTTTYMVLQMYSNFSRFLHIILLFHPKMANFEINKHGIIADIFI